MGVTIIYNFQAAQGKAQELLAMLQRVRDFILPVKGCEAYEVYQGKDDPRKFYMIERWASVEAHQEHFEKYVEASGALDSAVALLTHHHRESITCSAESRRVCRHRQRRAKARWEKKRQEEPS